MGRRQRRGEGAGLDTEYFTAAQWQRKSIEEPEEMEDGTRGGGGGG